MYYISQLRIVLTPVQVQPEEPLTKAQALLNRVFKEVNECRTHVSESLDFKLSRLISGD